MVKAFRERRDFLVERFQALDGVILACPQVSSQPIEPFCFNLDGHVKVCSPFEEIWALPGC